MLRSWHRHATRWLTGLVTVMTACVRTSAIALSRPSTLSPAAHAALLPPGRYNAISWSVERFGVNRCVCVCAGMLVPSPVRTGEKSSQTRFFFENPGWLTEKIARSAARAADRCASVEPVQCEWVCVPFHRPRNRIVGAMCEGGAVRALPISKGRGRGVATL